jgi:hypothetical protein
MKMHRLRYILLGFLSVLFGAVAPFLMVLQVIQASFLLIALVYCSSVIGVFLGIIGAFELHLDELKE